MGILSFLLGLTLTVQTAAFWPSVAGDANVVSQQQQERRLMDGVVGLTVFDYDRGEETEDDSRDFVELTDGLVIDLDNLGDLTEEDARGVHWGTARINIRATTEGDVGSVVFDYDDGAFVSVVRVRNDPYEIVMWTDDFIFTNGYHTLKVTGWSGTNANGGELDHVEMGFTIVSEAAEGAENVPKFTSDWTPLEDYPLVVGEAPSALLGSSLVVFNGFNGSYTVTDEVYAMDLSNPTGSWRQLTNYPIAEGVTHIPIARNGLKAYLIGGYIGRRRPAPDVTDCFEFDLEGNGGSGAWRELPPLPEGRGGGGAFYVEHLNTIVYSLGAKRNREIGTVDQLTTWALNLSNEAAGWVQLGDGPYLGNHIKEAIAKDCDGNDHYFMFGGQFSEEEKDHNLDQLWEYFPDTDEWQQRPSMLMPRGHLAAGEYSCGFLIAAGSADFYEDDGVKSKDVSYYDIPTKTWSRIGDAIDARNSYACAVYDDTFFCTGGYRDDFLMRQLTVPNIVPSTPGPTPTPGPGLGPPLYKLNCGGPGRASGGWETDDPYVISGRSNDRTIGLGADAFDPDGPDFIYNTERHDTSSKDIRYDFPDVPDGMYTVEFLFAEVQRDIVTGVRVFSFSAEGMPIPEITNFDIYAQVGFAAPITVVVDVMVSDGNGLQIESSATSDDAKVQGLIITPKTGDTPPPVSTPAPTPAPGAAGVVYRIDCGGPIEPEFPDWEADDAYTPDGRKQRKMRFGINHPQFPQLFMYNTERHDTSVDPIEYEFPVVDGIYDIEIYWIEAQVSGIGLRTMDVYVEGALALDDFDIYDYAAGVLGDGLGAENTPFIYTIPDVPVSDGTLSISFVGIVDDAKVNGLVISRK